MRKRSNTSRSVLPGESLHLKNTVTYASPHCHALFLGPDEEGDKVLLPTYAEGFAIVDLDVIDSTAYRPSGKFNIRQESYDKGEPFSFDYAFFDVVEGVVLEKIVSVKKINGIWQIISLPPPPSWIK